MAAIGRWEQRRKLVHDLVGHLLAYLAPHSNPIRVQMERLAHHNVKWSAPQAGQVRLKASPRRMGIAPHRLNRKPITKLSQDSAFARPVIGRGRKYVCRTGTSRKLI